MTTRPGAGVRRRRRRAAVVLAVMTVIAVAGLLASRIIKSPAEQAAATAPPAAPTLTAPVERRVLTASVIVRGAVQPRRTIRVTPPAQPGVADLQIVTEVRKGGGATVQAGDVLLAISGRPLIALQGDIPAYRTLRDGMTGPDVVQVRKALDALGLPSDDPPGRFGAGTRRAVDRLYRRAGFPAATTQGMTVLPLAEVAMIPAFPALVATTAAGVGDPVVAPLIELAAGEVTVAARVPPGQAALLQPGAAVEIASELLGETAGARVTTISVAPPAAPAAGGSAEGSSQPAPAGGGDPPGYRLVALQPDKPLGAEWLGQDVRVTARSARTSGPVLVVPSSALTTAIDGSVSVTVVDRTRTDVVPVVTGSSADGYVEVTPRGSTLTEGSRVVVGRREQP